MAADPSLYHELLSFVLARAKERESRFVVHRDWSAKERAKRDVAFIMDIASDVHRRPYAMAEAVEWLRTRAVRDKDHPDYDPIWTPPEQ